MLTVVSSHNALYSQLICHLQNFPRGKAFLIPASHSSLDRDNKGSSFSGFFFFQGHFICNWCLIAYFIVLRRLKQELDISCEKP